MKRRHHRAHYRCRALLLTGSAAVPLAPVVADPQQQQLLRWQAGNIRCGDRVVAPLRLLSGLDWGKANPQPITFRFRIDATGRALSITQTPTRSAPSRENLAPALAAARFAPARGSVTAPSPIAPKPCRLRGPIRPN